jgi:hypothetical protein
MAARPRDRAHTAPPPRRLGDRHHRPRRPRRCACDRARTRGDRNDELVGLFVGLAIGDLGRVRAVPEAAVLDSVDAIAGLRIIAGAAGVTG